MADALHYNQRDIARYLNNEMTEQEMHAFENAMLQDPFLADAFDGFANANAAVSKRHLVEIEQEIRRKDNEAKVLMPARFAWWKVAAMLIMIVGAGSLVYNLNTKPGVNTQLAKNETLGTPLQKNDSIGPAPENAIANRNTTKALKLPASPPLKRSPAAGELFTQNNVAAPAAADQKDTTVQMNMEAVIMQKAEDRVALQSAPQARSTEDSRSISGYSSAGLLKEFNGKIVDNTGEPLPFATLHFNKNEGIVADANGRFSFKAKDSVVNVSVVALGYPTTVATINAQAKENQIVVNEKADEDLAEVVVTGMATRKRLAASSPDRVIFKSPGLEPAKGWKHYNSYIKEQLREIIDSEPDYTKGEVQLEFSIDKKGRPVNIAILQSQSKTQADQAFEIVRGGPLWKQNTALNRAKLNIQF